MTKLKISDGDQAFSANGVSVTKTKLSLPLADQGEEPKADQTVRSGCRGPAPEGKTIVSPDGVTSAAAKADS